MFAKLFTFGLVVATVLAVPHHEAGHEHGHDHGHGDYVVKTHDDFVKYRDHCITKQSVPADLVAKYKEWKYPDDATTHCYMKCVFEQFGFFDDEHGFNVHHVHHQLTPEHVDHSDELHGKIAACAEKKSDDKCKWAYDSGVCFMRNNLKLVQDSVHQH